MTDPLSGTPASGPDTPGPEATPEQELFVSGLLASLRSDDPAMPEYVAARLDAVLAETRRSANGRPAPAAGMPARSPSSADSGLAPVSRLERKAGGPSLRSFRVLAGVAAAAVLVLGGAVLARGGLGELGSGNTVTTAESAGGLSSMSDAASAPARAEAPTAEVATGTTGTPLTPGTASTGGTASTDYHLSTLAAQIASLVLTTGTGGTTAAQGPASSQTAPACLSTITGRPDAQARAVADATFEGQPAVIIVVAVPGDITQLEVWAIAPGCTTDDATVLANARVPAP